MAGPHEERLRTYLDPARKWQVFIAKEQWKKGADQLKEVADAVQGARPLARANLGNHTADAADKAFVAMHDKVLAREQQMRDGTGALEAAIEAISRAEAVRNGFDAQGPLTEPSPPDWEEDEVRQIQQMKSHNARTSSYNGQVAAREEAALAAIQDLDSTNESSAETMRKIQGDRPDVPSGGGGGGGGGGGASGPPSGRTPVPGPRTDPPADPPTDPPTDPPADPPTDSPTDPPADPPTYPPTHGETGTPLGPGTGTTPVGAPGTVSSPTGATSGASTLGGLAGAVGGGLAGGAVGMGGAIRGGGAGVSATAATGASRPIGSSTRTGSSATLGRGTGAASTAGRGTAARGAAGRASGAAAGAGGRGQTGAKAGGRSAARGAAGAAGGRGGRRNKDDQASRVEAIVDDQDWVDDEEAAPGVIS